MTVFQQLIKHIGIMQALAVEAQDDPSARRNLSYVHGLVLDEIAQTLDGVGGKPFVCEYTFRDTDKGVGYVFTLDLREEETRKGEDG